MEALKKEGKCSFSLMKPCIWCFISFFLIRILCYSFSVFHLLSVANILLESFKQFAKYLIV